MLVIKPRAVLVFVALVGCESASGISPLDGSVDAAVSVDGTIDAPIEAGTIDANREDGTVDAPTDVGIVDAVVDAGVVDAGVIDATSDDGAIDATSDDGAIDAPTNDSGADATTDADPIDATADASTVDASGDDAGVDAAPLDAPCAASLVLCGGLCVDLVTSNNHCGVCDHACALPRASASCVAGACAVASCAAGYADCDGAAINGCEAPIDTLSDCRGCGVVCAAPMHGAARCTAAGCDVTCDLGYVRAGAQCVAPPPPRAIAPLSTATVTSRRPRLRWALASGEGAHVELCRDRALSVGCVSFDAAGSEGAPSTELAPGVWFWRLATRLGGVTRGEAGPTWQFVVGARTASVGGVPGPNVSSGSTLDVNGDGYADVLVGALGGSGRAYLYLGGASGLATTPATTLVGPGGAGDYFALPVANAGDVNGDGYADVVVGASGAAGRVGQAYVYLGGASGLASAPATTLTGPDGAGGAFGVSAAGAGDVNGDGYADVLVGASGAQARVGRAYLYLGGASGLVASPAATLTGPGGPDGNFGGAVASAGDTDGDGYADVVVGAQFVSSQAGRAYVFRGGATGLAAAPAAVLVGPVEANALFGVAVAGAGDLDGDGYVDVVVGASGSAGPGGRAYVFRGGAAGVATTPAATLVGPAGSSGQFGYAVASAGDVTGDGYCDLVVGASGAAGAGQAYVFFGGADGVATAPATTLTGPAGSGGNFGAAVAGAGDVTGDGYADLVVGAYGAASFAGRAYVYLGGASGLVTSPAATLMASTGVSFGVSVASARERGRDPVRRWCAAGPRSRRGGSGT